MTDVPEWALPIRDEMARAICRQPGSLCAGFCHSRNCRQAIEFHGADATAALTVALPLIAEHMAGAIDAEARLCDCFARGSCECACGAWDDDKRMSATVIAAAIRREAKTKSAE